MKKIILLTATLCTAALVFISCAAPAGNTTPANNSAGTNKAAANTAAAPTANTAAVEAEIKKLMDTAATALAKNDADTMEKIYADNYMLVNIDGSIQTKAERLASLRSGAAKYTAFAYSEPNIRVKPDGTAAAVIARLTMKGTFNGKTADGDYRVTQVYAKAEDGSWKQVTAQATKIETTATAVKADDKVAANANK